MNALAELISRAGREHAERVALVGEARALTFAAVEEQSNRLASALSGPLRIGKGDRVAILLANCPEFVVTDFALIKAALVRVPVNPRYVAPEIEFILSHSGAAVLVTSAAFANVVAQIRPRLPLLRHVIAVDALPGVPGVLTWNAVLSEGAGKMFGVDAADGDGYMIAYTSGTTGRPKGAFTTVGARWASVFITYANEMFVTPNDVMLHVASLAHGSGTKVLPVFARGGKNVLAAKFSPRDFFRLVEAHKVTMSWMVPTMVAMLADAFEHARFDIASLHTIIYGGAPMPEPVLERALALFGPIFVQIYGLTEAPHPDLILGKDDHLPDPVTGKCVAAAATGRAATGVSIRLVGVDGQDVAAGEVGELVVAGAHVMERYWNDAAATAEVLCNIGCRTGDLAIVDAHGVYTIVDRKKEMIISGGYNVYPREVEDALYRHPAIAECAVIGVPDATWGEAVLAWIVPKQGCTIAVDEVAAHCARELAGYKKPRTIRIIGDLPKTANGKIDKKALRDAHASSAGAMTQPAA